MDDFTPWLQRHFLQLWVLGLGWAVLLSAVKARGPGGPPRRCVETGADIPSSVS